jgi:peptidyl-prolyl cis-trans isomerase C
VKTGRRGITAGVLLVGLALMLAGGVIAAPRPRKGAKPVRPAGDTTAVIAVVGGEAITRAMVEARLAEIPEQFRANYQTPQGRQQLIDRLIEERVWVLTAEQSGVGRRQDVMDQLERQRRDLLVRTYLNEEIAKAPVVGDSAARAYYDAHLDDYRTPANVGIQHILLRDEKTAQRVRRLADGGEEWNKLVQRWSADTLTRATGGALGTVTMQGNFASIGAQPALAESAYALGDGRIGGPYKTDRGWHVIKVNSVTPDGVRSFEQMQSMIVRQLGGEQQQTYYQELLRRARQKLEVSEDSASIRRFVTMKKPPRELFEDAQKIGPADQRIAAYRRVVDEHPDADVSPQALFMVGFIHSEELKQYEQAEAVFRELLQRYPQSELAESARWMLEHMRSDEAPPFAEPGSGDGAAAGGSKSP